MRFAEASSTVDVVEVAFPAWPTPLWTARAVALAAPREWATQREAGRAAVIVAGVVGVPAAVAAGAVLTTFVLTSAVLLAPLLAVGLAWIAWRSNARPLSAAAAGCGSPRPSAGSPPQPTQSRRS